MPAPDVPWNVSMACMVSRGLSPLCDTGAVVSAPGWGGAVWAAAKGDAAVAAPARPVRMTARRVIECSLILVSAPLRSAASPRRVVLDPVAGDVDPPRDPDPLARGHVVEKASSAAARPGRPTSRQCSPTDIILGAVS